MDKIIMLKPCGSFDYSLLYRFPGEKLALLLLPPPCIHYYQQSTKYFICLFPVAATKFSQF